MNNLIVLKIGGSFINKQNLENLKIITKEIQKINNHKLIIVTGGGKAANFVRDYDKEVQLKVNSSHFAAMAAMELNSYLISNYFDVFSFFSTDFEFQKKINIFLVLNYYREFDPLPYSWNVSSDSIALELSQRLRTDKLILIKQRIIKNSLKIETQYAASDRLIDNYFPKLYQKQNTNSQSFIINYKSIDKLKILIENKNTEILNQAVTLKKYIDFNILT
jgi:aspartokinase-like uncharacterized kinase